MPNLRRAVGPAAALLVLLYILSALAPAASALDVSAKAIKVVGSQEYKDNVQSYSGEVTGFTGEFNGEGVAIAVLDTGVDDAHPTFEGAFVAGAEYDSNCLDGDDCMRDQTTSGDPYNPDDMNGHGTHVASIALGRGCCGDGPRGVAPGAKLVDVKIASSLSGISAGGIEAGIDWVIAYNNGDTPYPPSPRVKVISLSFGSTEPWTEKEHNDAMKAVRKAHNAGILVVVAAGNCGPGDGDGDLAQAFECPQTDKSRGNTITSPGSTPEALTVGAIDDDGSVLRNEHTVAPYSSRGPNPANSAQDTKWRKPDVVAPGTQISAACANTSPGPNAQQGQGMDCVKTGTSMAAPHVAGIAAILFQAGQVNEDAGGYTSDKVKEIITSTATDWSLEGPGQDGWDKATGYGYVDGYKALVKAINRPPQSKFTFQPERPIAGEEVTFDASLSQDPDEQDSIERFVWTFEHTGETIETSGSDLTVRQTFQDPGAYTVKLTAYDSRGTADPEPHVQTVQVDPVPPGDPGEAPEPVIDLWPKNPRAGQNTILDGSNSTDPDGHEIVLYEFDLDYDRRNFEPERSGSQARIAWSFDEVGPHTVALRVVDETGLSEITQRVIDVRPPPPGKPVIEITNPQEGDTVQAGPIVVTWSVSKNPADSFKLFVNTVEEATVTSQRVRLDVTEGEHTLKVLARGPGGSSAAWVNFTATDEQLEPQSNSSDASTQDTGDGHDHDGHDHGAEDNASGSSNAPDPEQVSGEPVIQQDGDSNDTPVPWWLAIGTALVVAIARRHRA